MAVDRMAERRKRTDQILVFKRGRRHPAARASKASQTSLDYRTRLRGAETRTGTGPLRRARLARISSSRHVMYRRLRLPRCGKKSFFPLCTSRSTGATHRETSVRVCTPRFAAYALSVIIQIPSLQFASKSPGRCSNSCRVAHFAAEDACDYL